MKAFSVEKPGQYGLVDIDIPKIKPTEVLLHLGGCGICGSDIDVLDGNRPMEVTAYPCILGHEFSGTVTEVGSAVQGFAKGDKAVVDAIVHCNTCPNCQRGLVCLCNNGYQQLGFTKPGGMAEYIAVPQSCLYKLPGDFDLTVAPLNEPASCAGYAVHKANIKPGDNVVIVGSASIAVFAIQIAKLFSPKNLIVIGGRDERKLALAKTLGATHTLNASKDDVVKTIMDITGGMGADAIIECSGNANAIGQSFQYQAKQARTACIGVPPDPNVQVNFHSMLMNDSSFAVSNGYTLDIWLWVLNLLTAGYFNTEAVITHRLPLVEVERGFALLRDKTELAVKVMLVP